MIQLKSAKCRNR